MLNMILNRKGEVSLKTPLLGTNFFINIYDMVYILFIIIISISLIVFGKFFIDKGSNRAIVRYNGKEIMALDLRKNQTVFLLKKDYPLLLGDMEIEVKEGKIAVVKEKSPYNYCSLMGFTGESTRPIICQPNKITITVENGKESSGNNQVDAEVR